MGAPALKKSPGAEDVAEDQSTKTGDMGYFEPQERRSEQINVRVSKTVRESLEMLSDLWTHMERVKSGDKTASVSISDVVYRLIRVGLDGAWAEVAGGKPRNADELKIAKDKAAELIRESEER